jgi:2',3'-cyclic-nucleotide 2'-phosphodiesterase/3'-nucleotidase
LLIGLFHSGIDFNYDNQTAETKRNENASQLVAERVPGFDIVFVGHDHHEWNFKVPNSIGDSVLILGPSARSKSVTVADVNFEWNAAQNKWNKFIYGSIINSNNFEPDSLFIQTFSNEFDLVKNYVARSIGTFTNTISAKESLFGNSSFVDLIHKIQLDLTGADISFTAPLSIYSQINEGDVFVKDMFNLYKYENLLYTMELTGREIKDYLEYSYGAWFNTIRSEDDNLLQFQVDENGKLIFSKRSNAPMLNNRYYNFDSAEGINYTVDVTKPVGHRVKITSFSEGSSFNLDEIYKVAINSYRGNGGGGHLVYGAGINKNDLASRIISSTDKDLRYYMMKWIEEKGVVEPIENINWTIEPKEITDKLKTKDYKLMFGK